MMNFKIISLFCFVVQIWKHMISVLNIQVAGIFIIEFKHDKTADMT